MSNIKFKIYKKDDYKTSEWIGGTTIELGIQPNFANYGEQRFTWRISSANVDTEESTFSSLPDYDRVLIVLKGEVVLVHKEIRVARLAQYEQDRFSGAYETKSFGKIKDFNLMVRKGNEGFSEVLTIDKEYRTLKMQQIDEYSKMSQVFYCVEGFCVVNFNNDSCLVKEGELLVVNCNYGDIEELGIMGEGKTIWSHIYFNEDESQKVKEPEQRAVQQSIKEKTTFEDIKLAAIICWSNFRGSKYIFKHLKDIWYDEALQKGINKIERIFLPFFISMVGFVFFGFYAWEHLQKNFIVPVICLWLLIDFFIINPLMYLIALPKPIKSHIKKISELTEYEKKIYERQKSENKRADKILKKYEITGRNKYID